MEEDDPREFDSRCPTGEFDFYPLDRGLLVLDDRKRISGDGELAHRSPLSLLLDAREGGGGGGGAVAS